MFLPGKAVVITTEILHYRDSWTTQAVASLSVWSLAGFMLLVPRR
jgi:hypothetical protein